MCAVAATMAAPKTCNEERGDETLVAGGSSFVTILHELTGWTKIPLGPESGESDPEPGGTGRRVFSLGHQVSA